MIGFCFVLFFLFVLFDKDRFWVLDGLIFLLDLLVFFDFDGLVNVGCLFRSFLLFFFNLFVFFVFVFEDNVFVFVGREVFFEVGFFECWFGFLDGGLWGGFILVFFFFKVLNFVIFFFFFKNWCFGFFIFFLVLYFWFLFLVFNCFFSSFLNVLVIIIGLLFGLMIFFFILFFFCSRKILIWFWIWFSFFWRDL